MEIGNKAIEKGHRRILIVSVMRDNKQLIPLSVLDPLDSFAKLLAEQSRKDREFVSTEQSLALEKSLNRLVQDIAKPILISDTLEKDLTQLVEAIKSLPTRQRSILIEAANRGWYINWHTPIPLGWREEEGYAALDAYMIAHLESELDSIISSILSSHPERAEILNCAFDLHKEGRYIASIPLFFAQADGVCAQRLGAHLFTDSEERSQRIAEFKAPEGDFVAILLEILGLKTQLTAGIRKSSPKHKQLAPNRNGILHGSRKHLDYGTKLNSFKALSLLAFVAFTLYSATGA